MKKITIEVESDPGMPPAVPEGYDPIRFGRPQKGEPWTDGHGEVYFVGPNGQYDPNRAVLILRPKQPRRWEVELCKPTDTWDFKDNSGNVVRIVREIPRVPDDDFLEVDEMKLDMGESLRPKRTSVHPNDELCVCGHRLGIHHPNKGSCAAGSSRVESGCVCCNCPLFKSAETVTGAKRKVVKFTFLRSSVPGIGDWIDANGCFMRFARPDQWTGAADIYQRIETEE